MDLVIGYHILTSGKLPQWTMSMSLDTLCEKPVKTSSLFLADVAHEKYSREKKEEKGQTLGKKVVSV